jgi:hypothetical protein
MRDAKIRKAIGREAASISTTLDRMVADLPETTARFSEPWLFRRIMVDSIAGRPQVVRCTISRLRLLMPLGTNPRLSA